MPYQPAFVSVTDHAPGTAWTEEDGLPARVALRTKPGTLGTAVAIRDSFGVRTVPHLVAAATTRLAMEDLLIDLHYADFKDIFVVRGDERYAPPGLRPRASTSNTAASSSQGGGSPSAADGYAYAIDLVQHVMALNAGHYTPPSEGRPTSFTIGVAGYPQKHFEAPNFASDVRRLKAKIDAGAKFVITQMLFEAKYYTDLVNALRDLGCTVPVIPGIKPILRASSLGSIPKTFFIDLPEALVASLSEARSPQEERAAGLAWAVKLSGDLLAAGAPCLHYFTMGAGLATKSVVEALLGR